MKLEALPKGFRFRPTDEELINHYLRLKINGRHSAVKVIPEIDVCKWEPWDLPALSVIKSDDPEWFFFCARDRKYPNGHRSNRATEAGYWKATGKDRTIKSRRSSPSGCSNIHLIGMKKTLVFYKGRAPKGERTNWIMHEYRATEPDLDGSGPEQGDYVLCRLFHKADEKLDSLKYDEVEPTGSSPSANKSSPDDESSDLLGTEALDELEDVKKRLPHETDCKNTTILVSVESRESDIVDYSGEERAMEVYAPVREIPMSEEATYDQFNDKVLDALKSENYTDPGANIGSPFANDFGNDHNELQFQDGTSEKDVSLSELLEGLQNHGDYFVEDSSNQKNLVITNQRHLPGQRDGLEKTPTDICKINEEKDIEMVQEQGQTFPGFLHVSSSADHSLSYNAVEKDDSYVNIATTSSYKPGHSDSGTRIKIRSRQQQNPPNSDNSTIQGTTSRRIRLWVERESKPISRENPEDAHESQPHITEAVEKSPVKHSGENGREKVASWSAQTGYMKVYVVSFYLVLILLVIFVGIWRCPSLHVLQG